MFEKLKDNEQIMNGIGTFVKIAIYGSIILGTILILEKVLGFGFEISAHLGLN